MLKGGEIDVPSRLGTRASTKPPEYRLGGRIRRLIFEGRSIRIKRTFGATYCASSYQRSARLVSDHSSLARNTILFNHIEEHGQLDSRRPLKANHLLSCGESGDVSSGPRRLVRSSSRPKSLMISHPRGHTVIPAPICVNLAVDS